MSVVSMYLVYSSHIITPLVNSSMYSYVTQRQVKGMVTLNLFIESPHGCALYNSAWWSQYHSSSSCGLHSVYLSGTLILLYFIEMLPRMVSVASTNKEMQVIMQSDNKHPHINKSGSFSRLKVF